MSQSEQQGAVLSNRNQSHSFTVAPKIQRSTLTLFFHGLTIAEQTLRSAAHPAAISKLSVFRLLAGSRAFDIVLSYFFNMS